MKTVMRLAVQLFLATILCISLNGAAFAEDIASGTWGDNLTWWLDSTGWLYIDGEGVMEPFLTEHNSDNGVYYTVSDYAWRAYKNKIKSVVFRGRVTNISGSAFQDCTALHMVILNDGLISIDDNAFMNCGLDEFNIPAGVKSIGSYAFYRCIGLSKIVVPSSVGEIGSFAFSNCTNLTMAQIEDGLQSVNEYAFSDCPNLMGVSLPNSVKIIDRGAFFRCYKLSFVTIPDYAEICDNAFAYCQWLSDVTIPKGVKIMGEAVFMSSGLRDIYYEGILAEWNRIIMGANNERLMNATLHCVEPDFILPSSLTAIESEAFEGGAFTYVQLPEGCTAIGWHAFADCPNLRYIYIPDGCAIDDDAFFGVSGLTILGSSGGEVQTWAGEYGYSFIPAD